MSIIKQQKTHFSSEHCFVKTVCVSIHNKATGYAIMTCQLPMHSTKKGINCDRILKTDLLLIGVIIQNIHSTDIHVPWFFRLPLYEKILSFAFFLALKQCTYEPALVQAKHFFWSTRSAIYCLYRRNAHMMPMLLWQQ